MNDPSAKDVENAANANDLRSADALVGIEGCADGGVGAPGKGAPGEWYSRGYLPHRDRLHLLQSVTFRLADSLPQTKLRELDRELATIAEVHREAHRRKTIEAWLDAGMGCCALRHPEAAACLRDVLWHDHGTRYHMLAWVVMPNHLHVLIEPLTSLAKIVQTWKSISARRLLARNAALGLGIPHANRVWMREYWDRFIRDEQHLQNVIDYIHENPVKAGLCRHAADWRWSSAGVDAGFGDRESSD